MNPTSENTAVPQQHQDHQQDAEQHSGRTTWLRPDFEAFDTALEVTAYAARD